MKKQQFTSLNMGQSEDFFQSDFSTETEQDNAIIAAMTGGGTGIQPHSYTGNAGQELINEVIDTTANPLSLGGPLYEMNGGDYITARGGNPIFNYPPDAMMDMLAVYSKSRHTGYLLEAYRDFLWSSEYFFYVISLPYNAENALITWKQTYRDQIDVPPKSFLIAVQAKAFSSEGEQAPFVIPASFRLQVYDDGAGEYLYDANLTTANCAGNDTPVAANGNAFGPFILPSALSIVPNGMLVVNMTNVQPTGIADDPVVGAIKAYVGLVFAIPKCANMGMRDAKPVNTNPISN
jgi:hypothetical protein